MISKLDLFQKPHSQQQDANADILLSLVNALISEAVNLGAFSWELDPDTRCSISGSQGGDGDGGFRTPGTRTGTPNSQHRNGNAVDVYDPYNRLDDWLDTFGVSGGNSKLVEHGLYREAADKTPGWCHLQRIAPASGRRTFEP